MTDDRFAKRKKSRFHRHNALLILETNVVAVTPKKNDTRYCLGNLRKCGCGALVFFPHTLGLYPVEVEMIEEENAAKAA